MVVPAEEEEASDEGEEEEITAADLRLANW